MVFLIVGSSFFLQVLDNVSRHILNLDGQCRTNKAGNPKGSHKQESCQACAENVCRRSRFTSENFSLEDYEDEVDEEEEEEEDEEEDEEGLKKTSAKTVHLTSDYESECEFTPFDSGFFKRSLSMPAKKIEKYAYATPVFFCET